jgi:hypothetical protein
MRCLRQISACFETGPNLDEKRVALASGTLSIASISDKYAAEAESLLMFE